MRATGKNFGRVEPGYLAHCWFGRPLHVARIDANADEAEKYLRAVDGKLALGCDGFVFPLSIAAGTGLHSIETTLFEYVVRHYAERALIYVELSGEGLESRVLNLLRQYAFSFGCVLATKNPKTLCELYKPAPTLDSS